MKKLIAAIALASLTACAQLGMAPMDSTAKKVAAAHATVAALAESAYTLRAQGALSLADKNRIADALREAETALDVVGTMQDPTAAQNRLTLIIATLTAIQAELAAHGK